jgi:predicted RND superfamily exporter protein
MNPFLKYPKVLGMGALLCLIPLLFQSSKIQFSSQADKLLATDQRQQETFEKLRGIINDQDVLVVSMRCPNGVFSSSGLTSLHQVSETLLTMEGASDIKSITHSYKPVRSGFSFDMVPLATTNQLDSASLKKLADFSLGNPLIKNVMVSGDGMEALINVTFGEPISESRQSSLLNELEVLLAPWRINGFRFHYLGLPLAEHEVRKALTSDIKWMMPVLAIGIACMLIGFVRSFRLLVFLLIQSVFTFLCGIALLASLDIGIPLSGWLLIPFWATIQWTLLMHCLSACKQSDEDGLKHPVQDGMQRIFKSASLAMLTTAIGMGSLAASESPFIREIGLMGAAGVILIFISTFGPGMSFLQLLHPPSSGLASSHHHREDFHGSFIQRYFNLLLAWRRGILSVSFLVFLISSIGLWYISVDIRIKSFLSKETRTRQGLEHFDRVYGGANIFQMEIDTGSPNGIHQRQVLAYLEKLQFEAEQKGSITGVYSYAQLLAMMNQIWEQEAPGSFRIPKSDLVLGTFAMVLKTQNYPFMRALCDTEYQKSWLIIRTPDIPGKDYVRLIKEIVDIAERELPADCTLNVQEGLYKVMQSDRQIVDSLTRSGVSTAGIILILLILLWHSVKLGIVAVAVNLLAVIFVVGSAGWFDIPFNTFTVMIGAMTLGIAVDDAVHFITYWRSRRGVTESVNQALMETLRAKGRPIVFTSLILVFTFAVFIGSSFPPVSQFAGLCALAFAVALISTCVVLPCLLGKPAKDGA